MFNLRSVTKFYSFDRNDAGRIDSGLMGFEAIGADVSEFRSIATSYYHPENIYISYTQLAMGNPANSL